MRLLIMRHGQAVSYAKTDPERALTRTGYEEAKAVAIRLLAEAIPLDAVLVSPYVRAQQTADCVHVIYRAVHAAAARPLICPRQTADFLTPDYPVREVVNALANEVDRIKKMLSAMSDVSVLAGNLSGDPVLSRPDKRNPEKSSPEKSHEPTILVVSHQPLVSDLLRVLVRDPADEMRVAYTDMQTASLASLTLDVIAPAMARLDWIRRPDF